MPFLVLLQACRHWYFLCSLASVESSFVRVLKKIYGHTVAVLASVESSYYSLLTHLLGRGSRDIILIWLCLILVGRGPSKCSHIALSRTESLIGEDRLFYCPFSIFLLPPAAVCLHPCSEDNRTFFPSLSHAPSLPPFLCGREWGKIWLGLPTFLRSQACIVRKDFSGLYTWFQSFRSPWWGTWKKVNFPCLWILRVLYIHTRL